MKKVLLIGSATTDVTMEIDHLPGIEDDINPKSQILSLGGCACNVAWVLNHFGVPFTLASPVGKGLYGDFVRNELNKRNISVWKESKEVNGSCICLITKDGNRTYVEKCLMTKLGGSYNKARIHFEDNFKNKIRIAILNSKLYETSATKLKDKIGTNIGLLIEEMLDKESD